MRRLSLALIAAVSTAAFTQIASAADLPRKAPAFMPPPAPVLSWTGWYVGLSAGVGWGNNDGIDNTVDSSFCSTGFGGCLPGSPNVASAAAVAAVPPNFDTGNKAGFIGGGQIGYNWQTGQVVWGIEADFQGADIKGDASAFNTVGVVGFANTVTVAGQASQKLNFLGTLRGRVGWLATPAALLYVTGGLAYGHTETDVSFSVSQSGACNACLGSTSSASNDEWRAGWTVGGGVEWMFAPHWSLKGEYLYYDLGHVDLSTAPVETSTGLPFFGVGISSEAHYKGSIARAGVNYKF